MTAELKRRGISLKDMDNKLCVAVIDEVDPGWQKIGFLKHVTDNRGDL